MVLGIWKYAINKAVAEYALGVANPAKVVELVISRIKVPKLRMRSGKAFSPVRTPPIIGNKGFEFLEIRASPF